MNVFSIDGAAFVLIGLVVLATPSPQPALVHRVDPEVALPPFRDTRRLLASQFIGSGLLALVLGLTAQTPAAQHAAAAARLATLAIVLAINASQLRGTHWKRPPLIAVTTALGAITVAYVVQLVR